METQSSRFARRPLWIDLASSSAPDLAKAIALACPTALRLALSRSASLSVHAAETILSVMRADRETIGQLAAVVPLQPDLLRKLMALGYHNVVKILARRSGLDTPAIRVLSESIADMPGTLFEHSATQLAASPACDDGALELLTQTGDRSYLAAALSAHRVPTTIQQKIVDTTDLALHRRLLYHPSVDAALVPVLRSSLLASNWYPEMCAAMHHPSMPTSELAKHLFDDDPRIAAAASDHIGLANGVFRLSEYSAHHTGHSVPAMNSFLNSYIERGLPLGEFVLAAFLLRPAYPNDPRRLLDWLVQIMDEASTHRLREIAHCSKRDLDGFRAFAHLVPGDIYRRLLVRSLVTNEITPTLVHDIANLARRTDCQTPLAGTTWRRIRSLRDLVNRISLDERLSSVRALHIKPFQVAPWLREIDGRRLPSGYVARIPKTTRTVVRWGIDLGNCLVDGGYGKRFREGRTIIIGLFRSGRIVYAIESDPDTRHIRQAKGPRNSEMPSDIVAEIEGAIRACATPGFGIPNEPAPG